MARVFNADPLHPPAPEPPYFDAQQNAWVLSRYADVMAAFRQPLLLPASARSQPRPHTPDEAGLLRMRTETQAALSPARLAEWQAQIEPLAISGAESLQKGRALDLVAEFVQPWACRAAVVMTEADAANTSTLCNLAMAVSDAAAEPLDEALHARSSQANAELQATLRESTMPMAAAAFVAIAQTLPCFLANAWLALMRHPVEWERLHAEPQLMPRAIEELLRYAGIAQKMFRRAASSLEIAGISMKQGERAILLLSSANRDPAEFPAPNRLDVARRAEGHVGLGAGPHSCVGAALVRMTAAVATAPLVSRFSKMEISAPVEWRGGSGFRTPVRLEAIGR